MMLKRLRFFIVLIILLSGASWVYAAEEAHPLEYWVQRALEYNPDYRLFLADYELALQELDLQSRLGVKEVHLTLPPVTVGSKGYKQNYGLGVQYSGLLPKKIQFSGSNSLSTDEQGRIRLSGNLQVGFNPRILWEREAVELSAAPYLDQLHRKQETRLNLVTSVVSGYIQLARFNLQTGLAGDRENLALLDLQKAQREYDAGLIALLDLYTVEDAHRAAILACEELERGKKLAVADFFRLVGQSPDGREEIPVVGLTEVELTLSGVDAFFTEWESGMQDSMLQGIYVLTKAALALQQAENAVKQARTGREWQFQFSAGLDYQTAGVFDLTGTLGLAKELYNPEGRLNLRQAEIQLERQKLAYQETKNQLLAQIQSQVEQIRNARADIAAAHADLQLANERYLRVVKQVELGFLPERDMLQMQVTLQEKQLAVLQAVETEIKARLAIVQTLDLAAFTEE